MNAAGRRLCASRQEVEVRTIDRTFRSFGFVPSDVGDSHPDKEHHGQHEEQWFDDEKG